MDGKFKNFYVCVIIRDVKPVVMSGRCRVFHRKGVAICMLKKRFLLLCMCAEIDTVHDEVRQIGWEGKLPGSSYPYSEAE